MNFFTIEKSSGKLIKTQMQSTILLMQELIKAPISVYDLATLDNIIHNSKLQYVHTVIILDSHDKVLSYKSVQEFDFEKLLKYKQDTIVAIGDTNMNLKYVPIFNDTIKLGTLYIVFDVSEIENTINNNKTNTIFLVILEMLISTIIAFVIGSKLTRSLTNLSETSRRIGKGETVEIEAKISTDEIDLLSNAIKKMQDDITARNLQLEETKKVFENIQEAIVVFDSQGFIKLANNAFFNIYTFSKDNLSKTSYKSLIEKQNKYIVSQILKELKKTNIWQGEFRHHDTHNYERIFWLNVSKTEYVDNLKNNYIVIFSDITNEKEKDRLIQIQSKMATMGEMIGHIAHQWRQPLSAISSLSSGMKLEYDLGVLNEEDVQKNLDRILHYVSYLTETIEDFRNFFKPDKSLENFRISELIKKTTTILSDALKNHQIELVINIEQDPFISGYKNELIQALLNILSNAKDVLQEQKNQRKKLIKMNIKTEESQLVIEIIDNGGGIPDKIIDKVFEPYFTTKHKSQGTGIGLYMTHTIIQNHHKGRIFVKNIKYSLDEKIVKGAMFVIVLDIAKEN